jgi:hypothetical protein
MPNRLEMYAITRALSSDLSQIFKTNFGTMTNEYCGGVRHPHLKSGSTQIGCSHNFIGFQELWLEVPLPVVPY